MICLEVLVGLSLVGVALSEFAGVYGGGCDVVGSTLYYAGGLVSSDGSNVNNYIYTLDMSLGLEVDSNGRAPWNVLDSEGPKAIYPGVVAINQSQLAVFGSSGPRSRATLWTLGDGKMRSDKHMSTFWSENMVGSLVGGYSVIAGSLTRGDADELLYYGGLLGTSPAFASSPNVLAMSYSPNQGTWREINTPGPPTYDHVSVVYRSRMLIVGGVDPVTNQLRPMNPISALDLTSDSWGVVETTGDIPSPRMGLSMYRTGNILYLTGGSAAADASIDDALYQLDLDSLVWTKYDVAGFTASYRGCLVAYKGVLVYSFGERDGPQATTQIIDPNSLSLVSILPNPNPNTPAIVASILAISVGAILILCMILVLRQRHNYHVGRDAACVQSDDILPYMKSNLLKSESDYPPPI